ncbi:MAG: 8-amino-7-oxononanoate synthase [Planctomycetota bacterium]
MDWSSFFAEQLRSKEQQGGLRRRGGQFSTDDDWLDFGSNDYLALRDSPAIYKAALKGDQLGSGASPVLTGHTEEHRQLEQLLAQFSGFEDALVFSSGYSCNTGVIACLAGEGDLILSDQLNHASLIDGCRLSKAKSLIFPHRDHDFVRSFLQDSRDQYRRVMLLTESVFSMDGDFAPLQELANLAQQYNCGLVVDEAHAMGVYGKQGSGLLEELGIHDATLCKIGTLSKAAGGVGGYACGSKSLVEFLVNHCRSYIFSTAPAINVMRALHCSLLQIQSMSKQREKLRTHARYLRKTLAEQGWRCTVAANPQETTSGDSPIIPVIVGQSERAILLSQHLADRKIYVPAIRPPTVPAGLSRLRISLSSRHRDEDLAALVQALAECRSLLPTD